MNVGEKVFFARDGTLLKGVVAKVLGDKLRVEFTDSILISPDAVILMSQIEQTPIAISSAPVIGKKKKK